MRRNIKKALSKLVNIFNSLYLFLRILSIENLNKIAMYLFSCQGFALSHGKTNAAEVHWHLTFGKLETVS